MILLRLPTKKKLNRWTSLNHLVIQINKALNWNRSFDRDVLWIKRTFYKFQKWFVIMLWNNFFESLCSVSTITSNSNFSKLSGFKDSKVEQMHKHKFYL